MPRSSNATPRLRAPTLPRPLHVVLVEPEIPPNTGNVARLCAAAGSPLHLVGPLGFRIDEHSVRRAGVDYWHLVDVREHRDLASCLDAIGHPPLYLHTTRSDKSYLDAGYCLGAALLFGSETRGFSAELRQQYPDRLFSIPTVESSVRSLNLANAVSIVLYEALRASGLLNQLEVGP